VGILFFSPHASGTSYLLFPCSLPIIPAGSQRRIVFCTLFLSHTPFFCASFFFSIQFKSFFSSFLLSGPPLVIFIPPSRGTHRLLFRDSVFSFHLFSLSHTPVVGFLDLPSLSSKSSPPLPSCPLTVLSPRPSFLRS